MKRDLFPNLIEWKNNPNRKPLIIRGARQVGKSWLIREFGQTFPSFIEINFEKDRSIHHWFKQDLHVQEIIKNLSLHTQTSIIPGETLLFLDEIQTCPEVINALRFFKEDMPELHVIAAGSLIEFALEHYGMPVGRVQFLYLYPLSFAEFLTAVGQDSLRSYIKTEKIDGVFHEKLLQLLRDYLWLGGMPAVINEWIKTQDSKKCQIAQDELIQSYRDDFYKYAKERQITQVTKVFENIPLQWGTKFKYSHIDSELRTYQLKDGLYLLKKAGIAYLCHHSHAQGQPLGALKDEKKFKVFFLDIGLGQQLMGLDLKQWMLKTKVLNNHGAVAEQFVAQELMAYASSHKQNELFYWHREAKNSNAEVDFITLKDGNIIPIEVKSGSRGHMKSMQWFLQTHPNSPFGVKISENNFSQHKNIHEIPLYALEAFCNKE